MKIPEKAVTVMVCKECPSGLGRCEMYSGNDGDGEWLT